AVAFVACGSALVLYCASWHFRWLRWVVALFACGILLLSGLSLYQDLAGASLGIDTFLYEEVPYDSSFAPGRMAPNAAIAYVLCAAALLLLSFGLYPVVVEGLAVVCGFIGLLGVLGYLYEVESLYGFRDFSRMSLHSALSFMILGAGILTARVDRGPMALVVSDTSAGVIMRRLLPIAIVLPVLTGFVRLLGQRAGYYDNEYGLALHVTAVIIVFVGLIWWNAISVYRAEMGRRRAEGEIVRLNRDLKRRVLELQTVFEVAPVGLAVAHDPDCREMTANQAFARTLGVPPGMNVSKTGPSADSLPFRVEHRGEEVVPEQLSMQLAARTEQPISGRENQIVRADGTVITLLEYAAPLYDEDGHVRGAIGAFVDITDLKRAESSLQAKTRTLETINRVNTQLAAELDVEQLVQAITDAGKDLSGAAYGAFFYNVTSDTGESYMLFTLSGAERTEFAENEAPHTSELFAPTFHGERIIRVNDVTKDVRFGKMAPHFGLPEKHLPVRSYLAAPVLSRSGQVMGALFFGHPEPGVFGEQEERLIAGIADQAAIALENAHLYNLARNELAERKKAERTLRELNETLEARVSERTAALERANKRQRAEVSERTRAERALGRTNAALVQSNRELQDFAYVASHDLQEPLRKIGSFAGLLRTEYGDALDETARFYIDRMQHGAERMSQLIHDLLSFSRITTRGAAFREVDLNDTLRGVLSDLEMKVKEVDAIVEVEELPHLQADPTQMRQLFQNLVSNALKFQPPERQPRIRIHGSLVSQDGEHANGTALCRISVTDNGIGFDEKYLDKVFSPFQRLHAQSEYPGTGMGLAICRRIVERHHGTITAHSSPGAGATFIVELPVRHAPDEQPSAEVATQ
ncbi:MAG TPA: ATP-binding protein, partial [Rhodothermales bacterium]